MRPARGAFLALLAVLTLAPSWAAYHHIAAHVAIPLLDSTLETCPGSAGGRGFGACAAGAGGLFLVDLERPGVSFVTDGADALPLPSPRGADALLEPRALAAADGGLVYALDAGNGTLHVFQRGAHVRAVPIASPGASALALDGAGRLLVADTERDAVCRFTRELLPDPAFGRGGCVAVSAPVGVAALGTGTRVLAASRSGLLAVFDGSGRALGTRRLVGRPGALSRASETRAFLADEKTGRLFVLDANGRELARVAGDPGDAEVLFGLRCAARAADGSVWLSSRWSVCRRRVAGLEP